MSQVVIAIDVPGVAAELIQGNTLRRVAEDTVRAIKKSHPVDDAIKLAYLLVSDEPVRVDVPEDEVIEEASESTPDEPVLVAEKSEPEVEDAPESEE